MKFPNQSSVFLQQDIDFTHWQKQLVYYRDIFLEQSEESYLLFCQDSYQFSLYFFALIAANKRIVLPPNGQPLQIVQCMLHADIYLTDSNDADLEGSKQVKQFDLSLLSSLDIIHSNNKDCSKGNSKENTLTLNPDCDIVFFTSGSSGQAKAINKTFIQLITEVEQLEQSFAEQFSDEPLSTIVMSTVSHQHIYGLLFKLLWPLWSGRDLYLKALAYPEHLAHQMKAFQQQQKSVRKICLISSPAYYHRLLADNVLIAVKSQFSVLFSSGGPLNAEAAMVLKGTLGLAPIEVFGSTETGGIAWRQRQQVTDELWQVFSTIQCKSDDEQRLSILSPYVDQQNWYQSDDRVELIDKNTFKLLGRADRVVKIEEKRCSLDELGLRLIEHDWVKQAYVLVLQPSGKRQILAAVVELSEQGQEALTSLEKFTFDRQLKAYLKQYFEAIVLPRKFRYVACLPYNSQGKLNKKQLESLFD